MTPGEAIDDAYQTYEELDSRWQGFRWRVTGPFLILLGVSQAVFGWAGDSLWMRIGYAAACVIFGLILIAKSNWFCRRQTPSDECRGHDKS
jgi:hypothetical protein